MRSDRCIIVLMRQLGYVLLLAGTGCSLIYNPSDLPKPGDAAIDMPPPVDADPTMLEVTDVSPHELIEGAGAGGSRRAVLVIHGNNFLNTATVSITAHAGETLVPVLTVDTEVVVSSNTRELAVPILVGVDPALGPSAVPSLRLDVTVSQPIPGDTITKQLTELAGGAAVLTLTGLDELSGAASLATNAPHKFSKVDATSISPSDNTKPLIVESTSSFVVSGAVSVNATGIVPGPAGNVGGPGGKGVVGTNGGNGGGPKGGQANGGGGGFGSAGGAGDGTGGGVSGNASLPTLADPNVSSGGAGNQGTVLNIEGGKGGAGGGSVMLTAAGNLSLGSVTANGGNGTTGSGTTGGGGSGGAIILRGTTIAATGSITATGGAQAAGAGAGGDGRIRFDAATKATTLTTTPTAGYRGPMLDVATPLIVQTATPVLTFNGSAGQFQYFVENEDGSDSRPPVTLNMPGGGTINQMSVALFPGVNRVCALVANADTGDESKNCAILVSVP